MALIALSKETTVARQQPGLDQRHRDQNGQISKKHDNTTIATLRKTYGENFAENRRSDMHLGTLLDEVGVPSLTQYLREEKH